MQIDRGFIKWQPFNSVVGTKELLHSAYLETLEGKIKMPILSEEQINLNEENILKSWHNKEKINIIYFQKNKIYKITNLIKEIDKVQKKIIFENNKNLYFSQIIHTKLI